MIAARIRLAVALLAFAAWLGWLALAVADKDRPDKVSRAQLAGADAIIVGTIVTGDDGLSLTKTKITLRLSKSGPAAGSEVTVTNLPSAVVPGKGAPAAGEYVIPLSGDLGVFRVSGLPRSPSYEEVNPRIPSIYPWTPEVQAQMKKLGYTW